jgi:DNA mismatch repair endonuclease MutH
MMQENKFDYDEKDIDSIVSYAKKLIDHTLRQMIDSDEEEKEKRASEVKGKFGQFIEKYYFGIDNNSDSEPDFKEVGVELKSTPIKELKKGGYVPKERLVLNIINYDDILEETWEKSHFLSKNELLLLIIYLYEEDKNFLDYLIKYVTLWKIQDEDRELIRQDWEKIVNKIKDGKAHELSEGDTFYLGACRKGHHEKPRKYSCSDIPAPQRAFSFKQKYMRSILERIEDSEPIVKDIQELRKKSFEEIVYDRFRLFLGLNIDQIEKRLKIELNRDAKGYYAMLARRMMGIEAKKIEEFEKADVDMKIIRLKHNGVPKEDMSFPRFVFKEVAEQEWEESDFYHQLESKFFFIVYQMDKDEKEITFKKAFFWNMPREDIEEAKKVWETAKQRMNEGIKIWKEGEREHNNLPNKSENRVSHVRPHGRDNTDIDELPDGSKFPKQCFWLNSGYLKELVENN